MRSITTIWRARRLAAGAIGLALLAALRPAAADDDDGGPLARARAAKQRVDYEGALREVEQALEAGNLPVADARQALFLRGEFLAVLGRAREASDAFVELLAVAPDSAMDPSLAPRVVEAFEAARKRAPAPARVSCRASQRGTVTVELEAGSSARARFVRVERRPRGSGQRVHDQVTPPAEVMLPRQPHEVACFAVDERGNALVAGPGWERPITVAPAAATAAAAPGSVSGKAEDAGSPPPWSWRSPWPWAAGALVAGGAGATFHWLAHRDQERLDEIIEMSGEHTFSDAEEVLARGRSRTRWARGLYIGAGALAAVAVTAALLSRRRRAPQRSAGTRLSVGPAGFVLIGEF